MLYDPNTITFHDNGHSVGTLGAVLCNDVECRTKRRIINDVSLLEDLLETLHDMVLSHSASGIPRSEHFISSGVNGPTC